MPLDIFEYSAHVNNQLGVLSLPLFPPVICTCSLDDGEREIVTMSWGFMLVSLWSASLARLRLSGSCLTWLMSSEPQAAGPTQRLTRQGLSQSGTRRTGTLRGI